MPRHSCECFIYKHGRKSPAGNVATLRDQYLQNAHPACFYKVWTGQGYWDRVNCKAPYSEYYIFLCQTRFDKYKQFILSCWQSSVHTWPQLSSGTSGTSFSCNWTVRHDGVSTRPWHGSEKHTCMLYSRLSSSGSADPCNIKRSCHSGQCLLSGRCFSVWQPEVIVRAAGAGC